MGKYVTEERFTFTSSELDQDAFGVVRFSGREGFSSCYEFDIHLVSDQKDLDLEQVLKGTACFTILREDEDVPFHGILAGFEQQQSMNDYAFYRAVLVPKFWWLSLTRHNQVFLDKKVPDILGDVLKDCAHMPISHEFKLEKDYPELEYVCQYRESHLNFFTRWLERTGMYYFFEQSNREEKVVVTDTDYTHKAIEFGETLTYSPVSGLDHAVREEVVKSLVCRRIPVPAKVLVNDYNYETPSFDISAEAKVSDNGRGDVQIYGEHFRTKSEGEDLAKVRAEELLCREQRFHCESTVPFIRPGYTFKLDKHYRSDFNQKYLTLDVTHEGSQTAYLLAGIQEALSVVEKEPYYHNSFTAIPAGIQFRGPVTTEKPRFYGIISAKIDAAGSGEYAELDDQGRYKVVLPFDLSGRKDGKASHWIRMAQPYAGNECGMHFPLHKGTEVLLTFTEGDPDRPIISGAAPNHEATSMVTDGNNTHNLIRTKGGNILQMQDKGGKQSVFMGSPHDESYIHLGAPNSPTRELLQSTGGSMLTRAKKNMYQAVGGKGHSPEDSFPNDFEKERRQGKTDLTEKMLRTMGDNKYQKGGHWQDDIVYQPVSGIDGNLYVTVKKDHKEHTKGVQYTWTGLDSNDADTTLSRSLLVKGIEEKIVTGRQRIHVGSGQAPASAPSNAIYHRYCTVRGNSMLYCTGTYDIKTMDEITISNEGYPNSPAGPPKIAISTEGDLDITVGGDKTETITGKLKQTYQKDAESIWEGYEWKATAGAVHKVHLLEKFDMSVGWKQSIHLGVPLSKFDFAFSDVWKITLGLIVDILVGVKVKLALIEVTATKLAIKKAAVDLDKKTIKILSLEAGELKF